MSTLPFQPATTAITPPAIVLGLTGDEYRSQPGTTQSDLNLFAESPLLFSIRQKEETRAMQLGTILHGLALEARTGFHVKPLTYGPENKPWNGNANECKAWLAAHCDLPVLSVDEAVEVRVAASYVRQHETCAHWLQQGHAEVSVFTSWGKGRLDYVADRGDYIDVIDLKACADARHRKFSGTIMERGYHIQAAWYRRLIREFTDLPNKPSTLATSALTGSRSVWRSAARRTAGRTFTATTWGKRGILTYLNTPILTKSKSHQQHESIEHNHSEVRSAQR
jgi:hypothetical protein